MDSIAAHIREVPEARAEVPDARAALPQRRREPARDLLAPAVGVAAAPKTYPPIEDVENGELEADDLQVLIDATAAHQGLDGGNVESFNEFIGRGIKEIVTQLFKIDTTMTDKRAQTPQDQQRDSIRIQFQFADVELGLPVYTTFPIGKTKNLYPSEARLSGRTYAAPLTMSASVTLTAFYKDGREDVKRAEIPTFLVAPLPVMVGSSKCHTSGLLRPALKALKEDPNEPGGYFIAKSQEWVVDLLENIRFNSLHVHRKVKPNEIVRGEYISQAGGAFENSSQVVLRYMKDRSLTVEINSTQFSEAHIPFYIFFRLFGVTSDLEIVQAVAYDPSSTSPVAQHMVEVVDRALHITDAAFEPVLYELDQAKLIAFVAERLARRSKNLTVYRTVDHAIQYLNEWLLRILDKALLPHIGTSPESRIRKLRFLGMLWHKVLLVDMGVLPPTDRDNYGTKRVHGAGVSIAKAFKTHFNNSVVAPIQRALKRELRNTAFEELTPDGIRTTFKNPLTSSDLNRTMEQAITSGNKTIIVRKRATTNRVSTQVLERKNTLNYLTSIRTVNTHNASKAAKQTERADMMRRVHPSYTGYICVCRSADTGEKVGMSKELAITAGVCSAGDILPMKVRLLADPAVTRLDEVAPAAILRDRLACVFVNGEWLGCCASGPALVTRYRALRREGRGVAARTSIVWDPVTDDVEFWLDVGRLTRPLLIVDNNLPAYDAGCAAAAAARRRGAPEAEAAAARVAFVQNIRLTPAHLRGLVGGALTLEDLRTEGILEWISPEEAQNCLIAPSLVDLRRSRADVTARYSHCDVPQAVLGLAALVSPLGGHTQPARVTYETNQGRQAAGWYCLSAPFRVDKNRFFQHYTEAPLVRTLALNYVFPNGINTRVAYMVYKGWNQEDSAIVSRGFVDRGGFAGSFFRYEKSELEKGEAFGVPEPASTKNLKPNASYEKLVGGFPPVGTVIQKGDVIIGKFAKNAAAGRRAAGEGEADRYPFIDRSTVYTQTDEAIVDAVHRSRGPLDTEFGIVVLRYERSAIEGSKLSSRAGNKSIIATVFAQSDMPYNADGVCPDLIINPHCMAGETPVTLACGLSRRIDSLSAGGERVWGWNAAVDGLTAHPQTGLALKGVEPVVRITLEDGRTIRCTAGHPILTIVDGKKIWTKAGELRPAGRYLGGTRWQPQDNPSRVVAGLEAPLDEPGPDEPGWSFQAGEYLFETTTAAGRERAMAFARLLGFIHADGTLAVYGGQHVAKAYLGHWLDVEAFLADVVLLSGARPAVADEPTVTRDCAGETGVWPVNLPARLARAMTGLEDVALGRRVSQPHTWPRFVTDGTTPVSVLREFLAGLFGGDGHSPHMNAGTAENRKAKGGQIRYTLRPVALSMTTVDEHAESMGRFMDYLVWMLERVGVPGATKFGPVRRTVGEVLLDRCQFGVRVPAGPQFADMVGFRYCVTKTARLTAATSYWRFVANVQRQHNWVISQVNELYIEDSGALPECLELARELLYIVEPPLNEYYSAPSMAVVERRRRTSGRKTTLEKLDYTRIRDVAEYMTEIGCYHWFVSENCKADYVVSRGIKHIPTMSLKVVDVRPDGATHVYDIGVPEVHSFCSSGVLTHNSMPTRMTVGQMVETTQALVCQEEGVVTNGTFFRPFDVAAAERELVAHGLRFNGKELLFNGETGDYFEAAIFVGPTFHQLIQKFVQDDAYSAGGRGPTDALTGQPLEGKNAHGGLRLGEMEHWVLESQGSMMNLIEKAKNDSDYRKIYICRTCGRRAIYNSRAGIYRCNGCGVLADIVGVDSGKASVVFTQELEAGNISLRMGIRPPEFEASLPPIDAELLAGPY